MINLLSSEQRRTTSKSDLITLEREIIRELEFSMGCISPVPFIERY